VMISGRTGSRASGSSCGVMISGRTGSGASTLGARALRARGAGGAGVGTGGASGATAGIGWAALGFVVRGRRGFGFGTDGGGGGSGGGGLSSVGASGAAAGGLRGRRGRRLPPDDARPSATMPPQALGSAAPWLERPMRDCDPTRAGRSPGGAGMRRKQRLDHGHRPLDGHRRRRIAAAGRLPHGLGRPRPAYEGCARCSRWDLKPRTALASLVARGGRGRGVCRGTAPNTVS
jgi:hypothetical protein